MRKSGRFLRTLHPSQYIQLNTIRADSLFNGNDSPRRQFHDLEGDLVGERVEGCHGGGGHRGAGFDLFISLIIFAPLLNFVVFYYYMSIGVDPIKSLQLRTDSKPN